MATPPSPAGSRSGGGAEPASRPLLPPAERRRRKREIQIAIGVLANTVLKAGVALAFGAPTFRVIVAGTLMLMMAVAAVSIVMLT